MKHTTVLNLKFWIRLLLFWSALQLCACVSINLPVSPKGQPAKGLTVPTLPADFVLAPQDTGDQAWYNKKTKNFISYMSECQGADPSLNAMAAEVFSVLADPQLSEPQLISFNDREALMMDGNGKIDGIPVKIKAVLLKKNSCNYTITLSGPAKSVDNDQPAFDVFLKGFKAP